MYFILFLFGALSCRVGALQISIIIIIIITGTIKYTSATDTNS